MVLKIQWLLLTAILISSSARRRSPFFVCAPTYTVKIPADFLSHSFPSAFKTSPEFIHIIFQLSSSRSCKSLPSPLSRSSYSRDDCNFPSVYRDSFYNSLRSASAYLLPIPLVFDGVGQFRDIWLG
jgi:hypothetical protein